MKREWISPEHFEEAVKAFFDLSREKPHNYASRIRHRSKGIDGGDYEIDIAITFRALQANFKVLVECKCLSRPVSRDVLLALHSKLEMLGAQKGFVASVSGFQAGARKYAQHKRMELIEIESTGRFRLGESERSVPEALPPLRTTVISSDNPVPQDVRQLSEETVNRIVFGWPRTTSEGVLKALKAKGWQEDGRKGHLVLLKKTHRYVFSIDTEPIGPMLLRRIARQTGLEPKDFA
jgi:predicted RNA binding protein YcfA (HicA-like mRNA interferase family)